MRQVITFDVPDKYAGRTGWRKTRNRIVLALLVVTTPLHAAFDCGCRKTKNPFWKECAARWLYLAICARIN